MGNISPIRFSSLANNSFFYLCFHIVLLLSFSCLYVPYLYSHLRQLFLKNLYLIIHVSRCFVILHNLPVNPYPIAYKYSSSQFSCTLSQPSLSHLNHVSPLRQESSSRLISTFSTHIPLIRHTSLIPATLHQRISLVYVIALNCFASHLISFPHPLIHTCSSR